jgi:ribosomal protein S18 acetylase RimI-like enzyme
MRLRAPRPEDASDLGRVHVEAWREGYKDGLMPEEYLASLSVEERAGLWAEALERPPRDRSARLVSVDDSDRVVGFILVGPADGDADAQEGEVYALNVSPSVWGRGHGRSLLVGGTDFLRQAGFDEAILWVHAGNVRARRFYEFAGWVDDGVDRQAEVFGLEVPERRYRTRLS